MSVTIKDVAEKANTSIATVSKVMNGSYSISEETVERVNQAIKELDYHPNTRARNLAQQSNQMIVFVTTLGRNMGFSNPHMFEMLCGIEHTLSRKGFSLVIKNMLPQEAAEYVERTADSKMADGFILHASVVTPELDHLMIRKKIPHLVMGMPDFDSQLCWIDVDNRFAGQVAARYLLTCGYRSVAFIGGREEDKISMHRLDGVMSVLDEHDVILPKNYVQYGDSVSDSGYQMTEQVLSGKDRPEAIICANNYLAYGCMEAVAAMKLSVPKDIGVLTFDDYPFSQLLRPKLTVVNIDMYDLGAEAAKTAIQIIKRPNMNVQSYITYPNVIERNSTRQPMKKEDGIFGER